MNQTSCIHVLIHCLENANKGRKIQEDGTIRNNNMLETVVRICDRSEWAIFFF